MAQVESLITTSGRPKIEAPKIGFSIVGSQYEVPTPITLGMQQAEGGNFDKELLVRLQAKQAEQQLRARLLKTPVKF